MIDSYLLFPAFMTGLLGSVHCLGMCGGLSSALSFSLKQHAKQSAFKLLAYPCLYNGGRLSTYVFLGAIAGGFGKLIRLSIGPYGLQSLRVCAGVLIISLGLYLTGWWKGLSKLETKGARLWQKIAPIMNQFMPIKTPLHAYAMGMLWGFLPCGLIYSTLSLAMTGGTAINGAMVMGVFGLGTLPSMLSTGFLAERLSKLIKRKNIQLASGLMIILFGLWTIAGPYFPYHLFMTHHCH